MCRSVVVRMPLPGLPTGQPRLQRNAARVGDRCGGWISPQADAVQWVGRPRLHSTVESGQAPQQESRIEVAAACRWSPRVPRRVLRGRRRGVGPRTAL